MIYTKEVVKEMIATYKAANTQDERNAAVENIAEDLGVPMTSVRSKLAFEHVYIAQKRTTKSGEPIVKKAELVDQIDVAFTLNLTEAEATSLEKATKSTLQKVLNQGERLVGFSDD